MEPLSIKIASNNRTISISAPVKYSIHASKLADWLDRLPSLKVYSRVLYSDNSVGIKAHIIRGTFTIEKFQEELETMSDLILDVNEAK